MPKLSILLSTLDDRIFNAAALLQTALNDCEFVVVHQITYTGQSAKYTAFYNQFPAQTHTFIQKFEKGTGKSRNCALSNAKGELLYICDDDIVLTGNFSEIIYRNTDQYPDADILTFMIKDPENRPYKKYFQKMRWHTLRSTAKVSNVEMVIRKSWLTESNVRFDERFGLGTIFNTGEEFIFLADALRKEARILFIPEYIAVHPKESSGKIFAPALIEAKGAMVARVYGRKYRFVNIVFACKKFREYRNNFSFFTFLKYMNSGSNQFFKNV